MVIVLLIFLCLFIACLFALRFVISSYMTRKFPPTEFNKVPCYLNMKCIIDGKLSLFNSFTSF